MGEKSVLQYLQEFSEVFDRMVREVLARNLGGELDATAAPCLSEKLSALLASGVQVDTASLLAKQMAFEEKQGELWQSASKAMMGEKLEPVISEAPGDKRFKDSDWSDNPVYSYLKQSYLLNSQMLQSLVDSLTFSDPKAAEQVRFYTRQYINSVSPGNHLLTNPEVCREIIATQGQSLVKGAENFMRDLEQSPAEAFRITQTDPTAFTLGKDLATTAGEVVFENDLIQLIHYVPMGETVYQRPVLITPPFINKYYILDLDAKKSLVRWLLSKGYAVFIISWVNPDASLAAKDFGCYMKEGPLAALDVVQAITGADKVNMAGFCVGGTLLATTAAFLKARGEERINSLTCLTTLLEFSEPGEVGNYLSEQMLPLLEQSAERKGVLDGRIIGLSFSLLRENNLFWSYFIHNYLKGKDPIPFDILHWNSDPTHCTVACLKQYVHSTYRDNQLQFPGGLTIDGVEIDLAKIQAPAYFLSTLADHIVLWQGAYRSSQLLSGPVRFVLAGSGHLAGVINPEDGGKYPHWINDAERVPESASAWFEGAQQHEGSWWPDWERWMAPLSGEQVKAQLPGEHPDYPALQAAPGSYVKVRI